MLQRPENSCSSLIIIGDYLFDPAGGLLSGPSGAHRLCDRMIALLCVLAESADDLVDREALLTALGGEGNATPQLLNQCVARLRGYFEDSAKSARYIETIPNRGYRLVAPIYGATRKSEAIRVASTALQPRGGSRLGALLLEFRERKVCRSVLIYALVVWFVFQVSEIVVPALALPVWVNSLVVLLGILGFPIAAVLAWIFDWTPNGLVRQSASKVGAIATVPRGATDIVFDALLVAAAVALGVSLLINSTGADLISDAKAHSPLELEASISQLNTSCAPTQSGE